MHKISITPRMTEKSVLAQEARGVYTFNVEKGATKKAVAAEIKTKFKVTPVRIHLVAVPAKKKFFGRKPGVKGGGKKAYVYLKKGDKIDVA